MSTITKEQAKSLAIRYHAYVAAVDMNESPDRDLAISVWGPMLLDIQRETGADLVNEHKVQRLVELAKRRLSDEA